MKISKIMYLLIMLLGSANLIGLHRARELQEFYELGNAFEDMTPSSEIEELNELINDYKKNKDIQIQGIKRQNPGITGQQADSIYSNELNSLEKKLKSLHKMRADLRNDLRRILSRMEEDSYDKSKNENKD
jgi:hypothetical protein